jgi:hypothetical protein
LGILTVVVLLVNAVVALDGVVAQDDSVDRVRQAEVVVNVDVFGSVSISPTE